MTMIWHIAQALVHLQAGAGCPFSDQFSAACSDLEGPGSDPASAVCHFCPGFVI